MSAVLKLMTGNIILARKNAFRKLSKNSYTTETLHKTALYNFHVENGGKMVPFAGYSMPVLYSDKSIIESHLHTRKHVSLFDVSHMLQTKIHGVNRTEFMESISVADLQSLPSGSGTLTVLLNDSGGIIDDLIITKATENYLYVVSNAGCREKDLLFFQNHLQNFEGVELEMGFDSSLIAIQGPGSDQVLQELISFNLNNLKFMQSTITKINGVECRITRCGYTGENGFEISIPNSNVVEITSKILQSTADKVLLAGLGARDTLRLEAGLCLYGNDIDETVTPIEASLGWLISKRRKSAADFPGASKILEQLSQKPVKRRVGFISQGPPARSKVKIFSKSGDEIGIVTSGCPSPILGKNISMGYIKTDQAKVGTKVFFDIRNKKCEGEVSKMPFVPHKYQNK